MKTRTEHMRRWKPQPWQYATLYLVLYDILMVNGSYFLALWIRFDCRFSDIPQNYLDAFLGFAPFYTVAALAIFWCCRLYKSIWRFASYSELMCVINATILTFAVQVAGSLLFFRRMPISYYAFGVVFQFVATASARFGYRFMLLLKNARKKAPVERNVMLIGAGAAGQEILRSTLWEKDSGNRVCCIIDDDPNKWGRYIDGVPVVGSREEILVNVEKYQIDRILVAIPSASAADKREILNICNEAGCELKSLPSIGQLITGQVSMADMKSISMEDLLGREPIRVDLEEVFREIHGKVVLVTGGGGSIGSELCRQIAAHGPKRLIIFDAYENNAYDIQLELKRKHPELDLEVLIGSVRDSRRLDQVFGQYRPEVVYHAAAHKHVPLMEDSPCESIKNNAIGTYKTAYAAMAHGCGRFVLISTDKAVNPTNIMGASKRLCEMVVQSFDQKIKAGRVDEIPALFTHGGNKDGAAKRLPKDVRTEFVAVRFGNVLGSNGSVVPLFKRQIARGGPVTVTHPDIVRYFMTIPEAVSLVLQAGAYAKGGEIFVLDMGEPVKIDTLARNLIRLSGLRPDVDIKVEYTGLRPGEKLYEEKLMSEEGLRRTESELIYIGSPIPFDADEFLKQLERLMELAYDNAPDIRDRVAEMVSTYHPAGDQGAVRVDAKYEKKLQKANTVKRSGLHGEQISVRPSVCGHQAV